MLNTLFLPYLGPFPALYNSTSFSRLQVVLIYSSGYNKNIVLRLLSHCLHFLLGFSFVIWFLFNQSTMFNLPFLSYCGMKTRTYCSRILTSCSTVQSEGSPPPPPPQYDQRISIYSLRFDAVEIYLLSATGAPLWYDRLNLTPKSCLCTGPLSMKVK